MDKNYRLAKARTIIVARIWGKLAPQFVLRWVQQSTPLWHRHGLYDHPDEDKGDCGELKSC